MPIRTIVAIWASTLVGLCGGVSAGESVKLSGDLELYYVEAGAGPPLVLIPGWTGTSEFFAPQLKHFAKRYRVFSYDPRGQGRSSKTLENNHYIQHGKDLRAFMEALRLHEVVLVAWSCGCLDGYAYFRTFGADDVKAYVCIDQAPRPVAAEKGEWGDLADAAEAGAFINDTVHDRRGLVAGFVPTMMKRQMTPQEIAWASDQMLKTPDSIAALLAADCLFADFRAEARAIDGKVPVLNIVSEGKAEAAKAWLRKNAPHSEVVALGNHMMFREFPDAFNAAVDQFLAKTATRP